MRADLRSSKPSLFVYKQIASGLIITAVFTAGVAEAQTLTVTIGGGQREMGATIQYIYQSNQAMVIGGSGSYKYVWSETDNGSMNWSSGSSARLSYSPVVRATVNCDIGIATYIVTVTDSVTGQKAVSNAAKYQYFYRNPNQICP